MPGFQRAGGNVGDKSGAETARFGKEDLAVFGYYAQEFKIIVPGLAAQKFGQFGGVRPRIGVFYGNGNGFQNLAVGLNQAVKIGGGFFAGGGHMGFYVLLQNPADLLPIKRHARRDNGRSGHKEKDKRTERNARQNHTSRTAPVRPGRPCIYYIIYQAGNRQKNSPFFYVLHPRRRPPPRAARRA